MSWFAAKEVTPTAPSSSLLRLLLLLLLASLSYLPRKDAWPVVAAASALAADVHHHVDHHSIIVIPYAPPSSTHGAASTTGPTLERLSSFLIDGDSLWQQISMRGIVRAIAERPELGVAAQSVNDITLGELYRTMFPEGVLRKFGVSDGTASNLPEASNRDYNDALNDAVRFDDEEELSEKRGKITQTNENTVPANSSSDPMNFASTNVSASSSTNSTENHVLSNTSTVPKNPAPTDASATISHSSSTNSTENPVPSNPSSVPSNIPPAQYPPTILHSSSTESPEGTAKVSQIPLQTIFAENEASSRITRSTTLTSVPQIFDNNRPREDDEAPATSTSVGTNAPAVRPDLVGFDSAEAGAKLREWIKAYFSG